MNLLMDTHVLLWWLEWDKKLSKNAIDMIEDVRNNLFVSIASLWEISIN